MHLTVCIHLSLFIYNYSNILYKLTDIGKNKHHPCHACEIVLFLTYPMRCLHMQRLQPSLFNTLSKLAVISILYTYVSVDAIIQYMFTFSANHAQFDVLFSMF